MLRRKINQDLLKWKNSKNKKCLFLEGSRQIGKTYSIKEFAKENYESFIELNFIENSSLINIFNGALDSDSIIMQIGLYIPGTKIINGKTLLFLDEVQECSEAITSLKFLSQDKRFDVICSGSALGIKYKTHTSYPVGQIEHLNMYPLDFEEFLWALNIDESVIDTIKGFANNKKYDKSVPLAIHEKMQMYLQQYLILGGMPEVIQSFVDTQDYYVADHIQRNIYQDYINDIARYANPDIKIKTEMCYKSIPNQLAKDNHKFQFGKVIKRSNAATFETSLDWLMASQIVIPVFNINSFEYPLSSFEIDNNFRMYHNDTSFLMSTYSYELKQLLIQDSSIERKDNNLILGAAKGGIYEAFAASILNKKGINNLHFYKSESGTVEIEFVIETKDGIVPIEIKAGRSGTKSLNTILQNKSIPYGYKFSSQNIGIQDKKITMPLYLLPFINLN